MSTPVGCKTSLKMAQDSISHYEHNTPKCLTKLLMVELWGM